MPSKVITKYHWQWKIRKKNGFCHSYGELPLQSNVFWPKNAESTYQQMMTKMFESRLGKTIEVYIDDMVVKSKLVSEHLADLTNIF